MMTHKRSGMPSKGWLCHYLRRFEDQRVVFELAPAGAWWKLCTEEAFRKDQPVLLSGVYQGLMKRPERWPDWSARGPMKLYLAFRGVVFMQGDLKAPHPLGQSHYDRRKRDVEFELSDIRNLGIAERLRSMVPRIGHNPGRINCSEGSSGTGFPSTKEPPLPPRGSNSFDEDLGATT